MRAVPRNRPEHVSHVRVLLCLQCLLPALAAFSLGCNPPTTTVRQMHTAAFDSEVQLAEANVWTPLGPPIIIRTDQESTISALFVAEAVGRSRLVPIDIVATEPGEPGTVVRAPVGTPIEVRITVDDEITFPTSGQLVGFGLAYETHSFSAFRENVPPGLHRVIVEWRSAEPGALMRSRTLTVWEIVTEESPAP